MEVMPAALAAEMTKRAKILTISLRPGAGCDAHYPVSADLPGENRGHIPRHAQTYCNFAAERDRMQDVLSSMYCEYIADVRGGRRMCNQGQWTVRRCRCFGCDPGECKDAHRAEHSFQVTVSKAVAWVSQFWPFAMRRQIVKAGSKPACVGAALDFG